MLKKILIALSMAVFAFVAGCQQQDANALKVGTIAGPETQLMEVAKRVAKKCYGLNVKIITFSDYNMPNVALSDGSIDANMFQHLPFLQAQIAARGFKIVPVGKTFVYPMGIYSKTFTKIQDIPPNAKVAIPNDPSNQARALLLLQKAKLVTLNPKAGLLATTLDVQENPKHLQIVALAAAQLPRALNDVAISVINTNYAIPAGLTLQQAIFTEGADSPYANLVVARQGDQENVKIKELVSALHSKEVLDAAKQIFGDAAMPAWDLKQPLMPCHQ